MRLKDLIIESVKTLNHNGKVYEVHWDAGRKGFYVTVDGKEHQFFEVLDDNTNTAQKAAELALEKLKYDIAHSDSKRQTHRKEYSSPLTRDEKRWINLAGRIMSLSDKEKEEYKILTDPLYIRPSLLDGTHPESPFKNQLSSTLSEMPRPIFLASKGGRIRDEHKPILNSIIKRVENPTSEFMYYVKLSNYQRYQTIINLYYQPEYRG